MVFLKKRVLQVLTIFVLLQMSVYHLVANRIENKPVIAPLQQFPANIEDWRMIQEIPMEKEVSELLKADDTLTRIYLRPTGESASLFVAFFRSQRSGVAPHSPKNCLPGNGWVVFRDSKQLLDIPGRATPMEVNHYTIQKGESKSVVIYWYQSRERIVASEYKAKFFVVADAIRYNRTDTALVRVMVPYVGEGEAGAAKLAEDFVRKLYQPLSKALPI